MVILQKPNSVKECVYFTRRTIGNGKVMAWVLRKECPKCKKAIMGKPRDEKGSVKIRAKEYVCPECKYTEEKKTHEESLQCNMEYTCPKCGKQGETQVPFKRKKYMGVDALIVMCKDCGEKIPITRKMKEGKDEDL